MDTTPVIVDGVVYALAYNGNLTALDLRSGQIMWKRELGSVNDFIVDGNRIYMVDQNDRLLALSTEGGVTLWTQSDLLHRLLTAPALYNGSGGGRQRRLYALDRSREWPLRGTAESG